MFDLLFILKEFVSGMAIAFCALTFCMSFESGPTMLEAARITWNFLGECLIEYFDKKKEKKFFARSWEIVNALEEQVSEIVGDTQYSNLCRLAQSAINEPLISICHRLGMACIKVSVYYANDDEKQRLENLLTNILVVYLRMRHCDTRVFTDWTIRKDLAIPVLRLHFAITKEHQKNLNNAFANRSKKIIAKNTPVIDDTEEVDLF